MRVNICLAVFFVLCGAIFVRERGIWKQWKDYVEFGYVMACNEKMRGNISADSLIKPVLIQHAGGGVYGKTYTNCLEALEQNFLSGERTFELDFDITSDNELVCLHGWEQIGAFDGAVLNHQYTLEEFIQLRRTDGLTQITLDSLVVWLKRNPGSVIVTDVKSDNLKALAIIASKYPDMLNRFIPQIYRLREYSKVSMLGFKNIILTLYIREYSDDIVISFAKQFPLYAITMWERRALQSDLALKLKDNNITVYAHTVNNLKQLKKLQQIGVKGVYTDFLRGVSLTKYDSTNL